MRKRRKIPFLVMSGAALLSLSLGAYSTYVLVNGEASFSFPLAKEKKRVCYITSDGGTTKRYFTDVGKAISVSQANDEIVVLPRPSALSWEMGRADEDYLVDGTYATDGVLTIPEGATLRIPYALDTSGNPVANSRKGDMESASTAALKTPGTYCKSTLRLSGVQLRNEGTIEVGGILSSKQANANGTGRTGGNYAELLLEGGASLTNGGELWVYGLIDDIASGNEEAGGSVENLAGSATNLPMCWNDFGGGGALKGTYNHIDERKCLPLDDFYFENIACPIVYHGGSSLTAWINFRTSNLPLAGVVAPVYDMKIIDDDATGILNLPSGTRLLSDFDATNVRHTLDFYGDFSLNALTIDVKKAVEDNGYSWGLAGLALPEKVSSTEGYFPISHVWDVSLHPSSEGGTAYVEGGESGWYKLMNGSSLAIDPGVEFRAGGLVVYDGTNYLDGRSGSAASFRKSGTMADYKAKPAECVVNGTLTGGLLAGEFRSTRPGAELSASGATSATMYEPKYGTSGITGDMTEWFEIPLSLELLGSDGLVHDYGGSEDVGLYETVLPVPTGEGDSYYWRRVLEEMSSVSIGSAEGYDSPSGKETTFSLKAEPYPALNQSTIARYEWSVVGEGASLSSSSGQETTLTLPANLGSTEPLSYTVSLKVDAFAYDGTPISLETSQVFRAMPLFDATSVSINPGGGTSGENAEESWELSLIIEPEGNATTITGVTWTIEPAITQEGYGLTQNGSDPTKASLRIPAVGEGDGDKSYEVSATVKGTSAFGGEVTLVSEAVTFTAKDAEGCVLAGTRILVPGGGTVAVETISEGDLVLALDHETGLLVPSQVALVLRERAFTTVCSLLFANGTRLEIAKEHGLFDMTAGKYVEIDSDRPDEYVGHEFLFLDEKGNRTRSALLSVDVRREEASFYDVVTALHLNYVANGTLSITRALAPLANTFAFGEGARYDAFQKERDVREYGLSTEEDWAGLLTREQFIAFNASVTRVGIAKGIYDRSYLEELVRTYLPS